MQEIGNTYGITKEAIRVILEKNLVTVKKEALNHMSVFNSIHKVIEAESIIEVNDAKSKIENLGVCLESITMNELISAINLFSADGKIVYSTRLGEMYFLCSDETSKSDILKSPAIIKKINTIDGFVDTNYNYKSMFVSEVSTKTKNKIVFSAVKSCDCFTSIGDDKYIVNDERSKVLIRIKKASMFYDKVDVKLLSFAINQSILHRNKNFKELSYKVISLIITSLNFGEIVNGICNFKSKVNMIELPSQDVIIANIVRENKKIELKDIECEITDLHLSKATVYQACSLSPLIYKKGRSYFPLY